MSIVTRLCLSFSSKSAIIPLGRDAPLADEMTLRAIAHVKSDFSSKFGIPRQSGVVPELEADIVFTPEFRNPDALRGLEAVSYTHLVAQYAPAQAEAHERAEVVLSLIHISALLVVGVLAVEILPVVLD